MSRKLLDMNLNDSSDHVYCQFLALIFRQLYIRRVKCSERDYVLYFHWSVHRNVMKKKYPFLFEIEWVLHSTTWVCYVIGFMLNTYEYSVVNGLHRASEWTLAFWSWLSHNTRPGKACVGLLFPSFDNRGFSWRIHKFLEFLILVKKLKMLHPIFLPFRHDKNDCLLLFSLLFCQAFVVCTL